MMKILIITQYFPPETGAPQNRLFSLAIQLANFGTDVSILTAMPNYPRMEILPEYRGKIYIKEKSGPLTIHRSYIYVNKKSSLFTRLLNYISFLLSSTLIGWIKINKQDIIICESPPLFLGVTALFLKWNKQARLVFNVSDLWPESVEKLGIIKNKILINIAFKLEQRIYSKSALVSGQTQGIIQNIKQRYPGTNVFWMPNGVDYEQFNTTADGDNFRIQNRISRETFILLYAGILGHAQGLETIIEAAEILKEQKNILFIIVGDGPEKKRLTTLVEGKNLKNIFFIPNKPRDEMPGIISACNGYIVPLKKLDLFLGAIPSKIFEPLAMGKPILLGVDGEARQLFIEKGACGLYYEPENYTELAQCISLLTQDDQLARRLGENGRRFVYQHFNRSIIALDFFEQLNQL